MSDIEILAGQLYEAYCMAAGGTAYDGKPLPDWQRFRSDDSKRKQSDAWVEVAKEAVSKILVKA